MTTHPFPLCCKIHGCDVHSHPGCFSKTFKKILTRPGSRSAVTAKPLLCTAFSLTRAFSLCIQVAAMTCATRKKNLLLLVLVCTGKNNRHQVNPAIARSRHFKYQTTKQNSKPKGNQTKTSLNSENS